jgi:hypothetical protein
MNKIIKIVIILVCVLSVLLAVMGWMLLSFLLNLNLPDTRGLQLNPMYMHTNYEKYPIVENNGKETVFISRFYDENNETIEVNSEFWNGACYALPSGKYLCLTMDGLQFYSNEIYVEFYDGYKCKLGQFK